METEAGEIMGPKMISKDALIEALEDILNRVKADDSFGGSIAYEAGETPEMFEVQAAWRVGNGEGQGGMNLIGTVE